MDILHTRSLLKSVNKKRTATRSYLTKRSKEHGLPLIPNHRGFGENTKYQ